MKPWVYTVGLFLWLRAGAFSAEIIAHRGASADAPENTMAAFRLGYEQKADAVELDIYLSSDNQIVVLHDADTKRTTGIGGRINELTVSQIRRLDAGTWKGSQWAGERIPTLTEVLPLVPKDKKLFIELKCGAEVLPALEQVLSKGGLEPQQTVLIGFDYDTMVAAKKRFPHLQIYWLASFKQDRDSGVWSPTIQELITRAKKGGVDGLNLSFKGPLESNAIQQIKEAGLGVYVWTVNDSAVARKLVAAGVAGITTDRPGWLREELAK